MTNRVGEVYRWTLNDDIIVITAKCMRLSKKAHRYEWEGRSLLDLKKCWFTESWFSQERSCYLTRIA